MSTKSTCFRVEVQKASGVWTHLFDADFTNAVEEVRKFKERGIKARFKGDSSSSRPKRVKRRTDYQSVR